MHPKKTAILTNSGDKRKFLIGGAWVQPMQEDDGYFRLLGTPIAFKQQVALLVAEMQTRARKAYHQHRKELTADAPLAPRIKLLLVYIRPAALWGCAAWPPHDTLLRAANTCQLHYVRNVMQCKRQATETWVDWNQRSLRGARALVWKMGVQRWSSHALTRIWGLWGHVARQEGLTKKVLLWRGLHWWRQEQANPRGQRHPGRFNPSQDIERSIAAVAGDEWATAAANRTWWRAQESVFISKYDPPWSSGKQATLGNLAPNKAQHRRAEGRQGQQGRGHLAIANEA